MMEAIRARYAQMIQEYDEAKRKGIPVSKEHAFIVDFHYLLDRYEVGVGQYDQYDGEERYCGTEYYIHGDNFRIEVSDLMKSCITT